MGENATFGQICADKFWDLNLTWYTDHPDLTSCFQHTVLVWVPCAWLWITSPFYAYYLATVRGDSIPVSKLNVAKTVLSLCLILISLINLLKNSVDVANGKAVPLAEVLSPLILTCTFILATIYMQWERRKGFITSGVLFIFMLLLVLAGTLEFHSRIYQTQLNEGRVKDVFAFVMFYLYYAVLLAELVLVCFAEKHLYQPVYYDGKAPCPETEASFLSRVTFWWINSLVLMGYKKPLEEKDLWTLNPRDLTGTTFPPFERAWNEEVEKCQSANGVDQKAAILQGQGQADAEGRSELMEGGKSDERTPLLLSAPAVTDYSKHPPQPPDDEVAIESDKKKKEPSLFWTLAKIYGPMLVVAWLCKLVCDLLTFVGPTLQKLLIGYTEDPNMEQWKGYMYAILFFVTSVANSFFFHQLFHIGMTTGMRVKAALIAAIYKKALSMSNEARKTSTVGEIVNLMSVDAQRMQDVVGYLWMFWSCPLQIVLAVYLLWDILGIAVLSGLAVMVLLIPINGFLASIQRKLQIAQMTKKDERIKLMNELLNGMKVLKLYAWELSFKEKVNAVRNVELDTLKKYAYIGSFGTFTWTCAPFMVTLASFATYVLMGGVLDAGKAFTSLSLFNILRFPMNLLPMMVAYLVTASVSLKRIGSFLQNGDIDFDAVQHDPKSADPITVDNGTFAWGTGKDDPPVLKKINVAIPDGSLVAVVGQVGAGKSSLISALLGEMEKLQGLVNVRGSIAYVAQQAWIQNATLKDNILFSKDQDQARYDKVVDACALKPDLDILPAGDQTEIGEKGINLSGGQKQRVSLARAVYQDSDIYLLDDPLSAVDSHVGKHIFENIVGKTGLLHNKTRVLVTHGVQWLPMVDNIIVLVNGQISEAGSYDQLLSHDGPFAQFLKMYLKQEYVDEEASDPEIEKLKMQILERVVSVTGDDSLSGVRSGGSDHEGSQGSKTRRRIRRTTTQTQGSIVSGSKRTKREMSKKGDKLDDVAPKVKDKLIQEETSEVGKVKWAVFFVYITSLGLVYALLVLIAFLLYQGASVASNVWLSQWTENPTLGNASLVNTSVYSSTRDLYLGVYGGLGVVQAIFVLIYAILSAISMVRASGVMHEKMLHNILRSPMSFFDTTPMGRILNRFSRDIETIDNILPQLIRSFMNTFFSVLSTIVVISYSTPTFLAVVVPLAIIYWFIQRFYIPTSRQLKRIESTSRSPIYVHFSETITGASTIRAYDEQHRFINTSERLVDHNLVFYFSSIASNRWLGFRLEFVGAFVVLSAALFAVIGKDTLSGGLVGLSISYALQVTSSLNWMVRMTTDLETNIVSVERVKEYSEIATEAEWYNEDTQPPDAWPDTGVVAFDHFSVRYRPELDLVLKGITFKINGSEKVGIVGRTGAGKSSMTLSLFRLIEAAQGAILIDNVNIATLGLHQLRSKITILPQDPVLFSGTMRMNLDPFDKYTDDELWQALENAHLKDFVKTLAAGLTYEVGEGGQNLSVGQRQLVCLGRTLLHKTKILILDEATAAVDLETDELIQNTIKTGFADCTIITIAHRINTIMDSDRVMVLDNGEIVEFDDPNTLMRNKESKFYSMAKDAGLTSDK